MCIAAKAQPKLGWIAAGFAARFTPFVARPLVAINLRGLAVGQRSSFSQYIGILPAFEADGLDDGVTVE